MKPKSFFEKYPKFTLATILVVFGVLAFFTVEKLAESFGLGNVLIYDSHPIYGYRPQPNQVVYRQKDKPIHINNLGLRAEKDWDNKSKHKILFLGDSVTYGGSYIKNTELFSFLAVNDMPEYESGNAGVNGWGILNVHALIKEMNFLPADIYVSVFPEGDFYRGLMRIGGQPFWTRSPRSGIEELIHYFIYKIQLTQTPAKLFYQLSESGKYQIAEHAALHLKQYDTYLKQAGKKHLIYISPSRTELMQHVSNDPLIQKALQAQNVEVVYLRDRIERTIEHMTTEDINAIFHDEIHLNEKGHALWAKLIAADLKQVTN